MEKQLQVLPVYKHLTKYCNRMKNKIRKQTEPLGTIQVTTDGANIRTEPNINDTTVAFIATKGDQFPYYEQKEVDGTTWYKLIDSKTQDQFWISSKTVKSIE